VAIDQRQLLAYLSGDADFRAWGSGLSAQLAAVGLVKTADTGQIDWTTAVRPAASGYSGYEIWRFNDTLQATKPVYIKIEYGGSSTVDRPSFRATIGTGTNGAGILTGQLGVVRSFSPSGSKTAGATLASYCSGSSNRLNLVTNLDNGSASYAMTFLVERTKTADGSVTGDGIVSLGIVASSSATFQVIPFSGTIPASASLNMALGFDGMVSSAGVQIALNPTFAAVGKSLMASWLSYKHVDIGELVPFSINHLGGLHTYMPMGDGVSGAYVATPSAAANALAMLWE
jgi:hypothetical protein